MANAQAALSRALSCFRFLFQAGQKRERRESGRDGRPWPSDEFAIDHRHQTTSPSLTMDHDGRKRLPHELPLFVDPETAVFFLTICAKERDAKPLIQSSIPTQLLDSIRHYHRSGNWWIHLVVIMPDHIHLLASFAKPLTKTVFDWKQWTARHLGVIWQREFFEHRLRSEGDYREKADYILMNPVRAGLVEDWPDWPHRWIPEV